KGWALICIDLPTISGSAPNWLRHRLSAINAMRDPPARSSASVKLRPIAGCTPRVSISPRVTLAEVTRIGSLEVAALTPPEDHAPMLSQDWASLLMSTNSGTDIQNFFRSIVGNSV